MKGLALASARPYPAGSPGTREDAPVTARIFCFALLALALAGAGCFKSSTFQASSESSSKVLSSPFKWSSSSSSGDDDDETSEDVASVTERWVHSGDDTAALRARISRIAEQEGVSDWEADEEIHVAIGRGLWRSRASGPRRTALERELAAGDSRTLAWMQRGYQKEKLD